MTNVPDGGGGDQGDDVNMRDMAAKHQRLVVANIVKLTGHKQNTNIFVSFASLNKIG